MTTLRRIRRTGLAVEFEDEAGRRFRMHWLPTQRRFGLIQSYILPGSGLARTGTRNGEWADIGLLAPPRSHLEPLVLPKDHAHFVAASMIAT